jgi:hypothetical protein
MQTRRVARGIGGDRVEVGRVGLGWLGVGDATVLPRGCGGRRPPQLAYALSDSGAALIPALEQISLWAQEHLPAGAGPSCRA